MGVFMKICDINPFIRFSQHIVQTRNSCETITCDHRLFYVTNGECSMMIKGNKYDLQKGSLARIKSGTKYKFNINEQIELIVLNFDYTQKCNDITDSMKPVNAENFDTGNILEKDYFSDATMLNSPIVILRIFEIKQQLERIVEEQRKGILYSNEFSSAILKEIILKVLRNAMFSTTDAHEKILRVIRYIEENYSKNITNDELAKISGYHPYHLNRLMNEYAKTSLHKYLVNYRLKKAQEYLINTNLSVSEISDLSGFETSYYFSTLFKNKTGVSPLQYRKNKKLI